MEKVAFEEKVKKETKKPSKKKVVFVIAFKDFRDPEYFLPRKIFKKVGIETKVASNQKGMALGAEGGKVAVDLLIEEVNPENFDAIIFIGGPGCLEALDNEKSYELVRKAVNAGKILAAICISPVILAKAGVLEGKRATVWSSPFDKSSVKILEENKCQFIDKNVVQDGKIITANGPEAAQEFGKKILKSL